MRYAGALALLILLPATSASAEDYGQVHDAIHHCQPKDADQPETIISACLKAIDSNLLERDSLAQAWINVAGAHLILKQYDEALAAAGHAIDADPKKWKGWINRAAAEAALGKLDAALADANTAMQLADKEPGPPRVMGQIYMAQGNLTMAVASLSMAIDNGDVPSYGLRARVYDHTGEPDKAAADRAKLKELDPDDKYGLQKP